MLGLYREINVDTVIGPIVLIPAQAVVIELLAVFLILIRAVGDRRPGPPEQRPPLDVIIPAYNESVCIERMLWSIDRAAGRYGRPVRVIMCDDESTDDTRAVAEATMASFGYATGEVIHSPHGGKSLALNMALERCIADFVYRLDADCARALTLVPKFFVLAYYRRLRLLPWALLWMPFKQLKRFFLLEALLAFQMRPVKPPLALRARYPTWRSMLAPWRSPATENAGA
jgi:Glycosyl transferase family 2